MQPAAPSPVRSESAATLLAAFLASVNRTLEKFAILRAQIEALEASKELAAFLAAGNRIH